MLASFGRESVGTSEHRDYAGRKFDFPWLDGGNSAASANPTINLPKLVLVCI